MIMRRARRERSASSALDGRAAKVKGQRAKLSLTSIVAEWDRYSYAWIFRSEAFQRFAV